MLHRLVTSGVRARAVACPSVTAVRAFAKKAKPSELIMRPIHFEEDEDVRITRVLRQSLSASNSLSLSLACRASREQDTAERPFRIVGVRDVEVQDWNFPTRMEADQKKKYDRVVRNRFQHPNFISLWVDKLNEVESYLKAEKVPYTSEGIVAGPEGYDVLVIPPSEDGSSVEFFNLCDSPTMVELVQATPEVIKEFEDEEE
ncbi:hypothetical protein BBJ28_00018549 [Nothophytophthora sp. Chile5]|nr:hypothetical protein BBJ28_00018549 [Nothophytophthora sp. Chile5]